MTERGTELSAARPGIPAARALRSILALALLAGVLAGCGRGAKSAGGSATKAPGGAAGRARSQAFIESGNDAYRASDYELALKRYAAAAVADPRDPAAYFGMGMTFTRLKREDEARAAFARAQELSREAEPGEAAGAP